MNECHALNWWRLLGHGASMKNGYAYNEMITKFDMSDTLLGIAFCRYHQETESLSVCVCGRHTAQFVYEPTGWQSTFQVLRRKSEILLAYIRQCVAALVDRELINTYIEN